MCHLFLLPALLMLLGTAVPVSAEHILGGITSKTPIRFINVPIKVVSSSPPSTLEVVATLRGIANDAGVADQFIVNSNNIVITNQIINVPVGFRSESTTTQQDAVKQFIQHLEQQSTGASGVQTFGRGRLGITSATNDISPLDDVTISSQTCDDGSNIDLNQHCPITSDGSVMSVPVTSTPMSSGSSRAVIIGSVIGGVTLLLIVLVIGMLIYRRKHTSTVTMTHLHGTTDAAIHV